MKTWAKISVCISVFFMFCFICIGYAALSDHLLITGTAETDIPSGLFIIDVSTKNETYVDKNQVEFVPYTTTLKSTISRSSRYSSGAVTYHITVLNNTKLTYSYRDIYFQANLTGYNGNTYVSTSNSNRNIGVVCELKTAAAEDKKVAPGETLEFDVTYTVGTSRDRNTDWATMINFQFGINVDGEREALDVIESKFLNILNTQSTYEQLLDVLDNKFDGRQEWTSNYVGNVQSSTSEDSVAVNTLFAGQLQITVGKEQMDATVLIKHENLDGNTMTGDDYTAVNSSNGGVFNGYGCEMTLYLTIDPLDDAGAYVPVYVAVFTCDRDENGNIVGDWYRIGDTYSGEANVVSYEGGNGTGSFVTDNWIALRESYSMVEGYSYDISGVAYRLDAYSYDIAAGVNIESIVMAHDERAVSIFQTLLNDAKKIIDGRDYAGTGIDIVEEVYASLSGYYTLDENGNPVANADLTRCQLSPVISDLYYVVNETLMKMEALSQGS